MVLQRVRALFTCVIQNAGRELDVSGVCDLLGLDETTRDAIYRAFDAARRPASDDVLPSRNHVGKMDQTNRERGISIAELFRHSDQRQAIGRKKSMLHGLMLAASEPGVTRSDSEAIRREIMEALNK